MTLNTKYRVRDVQLQTLPNGRVRVVRPTQVHAPWRIELVSVLRELDLPARLAHAPQVAAFTGWPLELVRFRLKLL